MAMFIHVNALYDYFHVIIAELSLVKETIWPTKLKIYILGLYSTSVLNPVLCQWFPNFSAHWNHLENLKPCCCLSLTLKVENQPELALGFIKD